MIFRSLDRLRLCTKSFQTRIEVVRLLSPTPMGHGQRNYNFKLRENSERADGNDVLSSARTMIQAILFNIASQPGCHVRPKLSIFAAKKWHQIFSPSSKTHHSLYYRENCQTSSRFDAAIVRRATNHQRFTAGEYFLFLLRTSTNVSTPSPNSRNPRRRTSEFKLKIFVLAFSLSDTNVLMFGFEITSSSSSSSSSSTTTTSSTEKKK